MCFFTKRFNIWLIVPHLIIWYLNFSWSSVFSQLARAISQFGSWNCWSKKKRIRRRTIFHLLILLHYGHWIEIILFVGVQFEYNNIYNIVGKAVKNPIKISQESSTGTSNQDVSYFFRQFQSKLISERCS